MGVGITSALTVKLLHIGCSVGQPRHENLQQLSVVPVAWFSPATAAEDLETSRFRPAGTTTRPQAIRAGVPRKRLWNVHSSSAGKPTRPSPTA